MLATSASSLSSSIMAPSSSSTLQEGDGVRKSGPIVLLQGGHSANKKRGIAAYAVLSERALELYDSEKAYRKKKGHRSIVDLSKCFNVSQQNCPRPRVACVCLLMPDECFLFRADQANETAEWFCTLLSTVISARALHLGRPVFANEFFESVWDVTVCPQQPKLKRVPPPPANTTEFANSPNICARVKELAGRKRLCFYPHTIILCKVGIEPAHSGLPKSGIPPFQPIDFVEFSRHFIAQFGPIDKYFLMRIGRSSPMGSCEVWVQCESEEAAAEINFKLQEIIQRETEKKEQALMAIRGQQQQHHRHTGGPAAASAQMAGQGVDQRVACTPSSSSSSAPNAAVVANANDVATVPMPSATAQAQQQYVMMDNNKPESIAGDLEPISEDEQQQSPLMGGGTATPPANGGNGRKKHSSLSQSAREKRMELRECKAKVDSLEEEEQRFQQRQLMAAQQQQATAAWNCCSSKYYGGVGSSISRPMYTAMRSCESAGPSGSAGSAAPVNVRPNSLLGHQPVCGYQIHRRRGSGGSVTEINPRSKSLSLEEQQAQCFRPFGPAGGRLWTMDKADSLLLLGYGPPELMAAEETEDSGGTLRLMPCEGSSQAPSRSSSSLNLAATGTGQQSTATGLHQQLCSSSHSSSAGQLVETYVEFHAAAGDEEDKELEEHDGHVDDDDVSSGTSSGDEEEEGDGSKGIPSRTRRKSTSAAAIESQKRRRQQRQLGGSQSGGGSLDTGTEADQSCSCSSSVASNSGHDEQPMPPIAVDEPTKKQRQNSVKRLLEQQQQQQQPLPLPLQKQPSSDYTLMDKVSCSSDSFSHLAVPQQWDRQQNFCPEEICSYTSDSGDSCYSSMVNGQLNPRAFSFSSTSDAPPSRTAAYHSHFGTGTSGRLGSTGSGTGSTHQQQHQHPAAAKWTAAMAMGGHHRQHLAHQSGGTAAANFSPQKSHGHGGHGGGHHGHHHQQQLESSSSSRFSMETSLITPLEEEERQVTFADEEQRDRLGEAPLSSSRDYHHHENTAGDGGGDDMLRKRAFSLGSKSWITKPFRKLSSATGTPLSGRQQRSSCGGASSRSGSSSLIGSMHADLCNVQEQQSSSSSNNRLGGDADGHHSRSGSVGSSHSAAVSLPGGQRTRRKQPSGDDLLQQQSSKAGTTEQLDLVELEFMPGGGRLAMTMSGGDGANRRSAQCVATAVSSAAIGGGGSLRGRTNSCDDYNVVSSSSMAAVHHQQQKGSTMSAKSAAFVGGTSSYGSPSSILGGGGGSIKGGRGTPRSRGSAGALNQQGQGSGTQQTAGAGGQQQFTKQRLRPSESFIRSIQQQQRELQKTTQQQQKRQRVKSDFPLQEVQCFIAPAEREKIDAMTARDSLSLRSQRSGSGSCSQQFETIEEGCQQQHQPGGTASSRPQSRRSLTRPAAPTSPQPKQPAVVDEQTTTNVAKADNEEDDDYVLGEAKPKTALEA